VSKKKIVGIGKTKHWLEGRRVKNVKRKLKKRISTQKPENQEKILNTTEIGRIREGGSKQNSYKNK
jgi:hypothetical protein